MKKRYPLSAASSIMVLSIFFILSILSILSLPLAFSASLDDIGMSSAELDISLVYSSELSVIATSNNPLISDLEWRIHYDPIDTWQQSVLSKDVTPTSVDSSGLLFRWASPDISTYNFNLDADVTVRNDMPKITSRRAFPITNLDEDMEQYIMPTGNAESNDPEIIARASELVSGQDDLNQAVFKLFTWVADNVEYRRTAITEDTAQSASWTLENRYGVCDEMANLLIALARSVGIPARYVSGVAYSNLAGSNTWEPHAWAELNIPGYGWVPFDPTYREYGYVDPTHIVLQYGLDSNQSTSTVTWVGKDTRISQTQLDISASLKRRSGTSSDVVSLTVEPLRQSIGFGSYTIVEAEVKNPNNYYVYTDLTLSKANYFSTSDNLKQAVLLGPNEEKSVYWLVKVSTTLDPRLLYTLPMVVTTSRNTTVISNVFAESRGQVYTKQEMEQLLADLREEAQYHYSKNLELSCTPEKSELYPYEGQAIFCTIRNLGNVPLNSIKICRETDCTTLSIGISKSATHNFTLQPQQPGQYDASIKITGSDLYKTSSVRYKVLDEPVFSIDRLSYPSEVSYSGSYNLSCFLKHDSNSPAYNISLAIINRKPTYFNFTSLAMDQPVILYFEGYNLKYGENQIELLLRYDDLNGKEHTTTQTITISLTDATILERIYLVLVDASLWLEDLFT